MLYSRYKSDEIVVGEGISASITIRNDMSVKLYIEIKKRESGFEKYSLCIDTTVLDVVDIQMFDGINGSIVCAEVSQQIQM